MNIADGMKNITENIIASYNVRIKAVGDLFDEVNETLTKFTADRKKMSAKQAAELQRFASDVASEVGKKLKDYRNDHAEVSKILKRDLAAYVKNIVDTVGGMLKGYRDDINGASDAWKGMTRTLAKSHGKIAGAGGIAGEQSVDTVEGAVRKIKARRKKRK